jgi:hypothetical protein
MHPDFGPGSSQMWKSMFKLINGGFGQYEQCSKKNRIVEARIVF